VIDPGSAAPLRIEVLSAFAQAPEARAPTGPRPSTAEELAARASTGDAEALRALLVIVGPHVLRTVRRIVLVPADADDAAQDAMTAFVRDFPSLRQSSAVVAFATRVAARIAWRVRARNRREQRGREHLAASTTEVSAMSPVAELAARERAERLLSALERLPEAQAETLVLRYVAGLQPAEIADAMQVPVNTVRSRVRLAREALARWLVNEPWLLEKGE
jgi:RNA polymerase sigma-70 factor (ECF subfamily)